MKNVHKLLLFLSFLLPLSVAHGGDEPGEVSAMPAFGNDANVMKHLDDLYRYIKARSDGALPAGRPKKIPK